MPGHRRFINNMISGVSGIDLGMLVVAADDGPMPQTHEHLQVMRLLGVQDYCLVISKCDRVDEKRLAEVYDAASSLLPEGTPVYKVSNETGDGIEALRDGLELLAQNQGKNAARGHFRMSIDRSFNLQGLGLVLTGTITSGRVAVGDTVSLQPQETTLRIRGMHVQDTPADNAQAGDRCALNVSGDAHKDNIARGDWVAGEDCVATTSRFDTRVQLLSDAAFSLKHLSDVKLHIGAKQQVAKLLLLKPDDSSQSRIDPGGTAHAQLVTGRPILCCHGDRFLIRDYGETATLGGGIVLDPHGRRNNKASASRRAYLAAMEEDDLTEAISKALEYPDCVLNYDKLRQAWNVCENERPGETLSGISRKKSEQGEIWLAESFWIRKQEQLLEKLTRRLMDKPGEKGIKPAQLMHDALPPHELHLFLPLITELAKSGDIVMRDGLLATRGHQASTATAEDHDWQLISVCLDKHGTRIPVITELESECGLSSERFQAALGRAVRKKALIKLNTKRFTTPSVLLQFAEAALNLTRDANAFSLVEIRDRLGCGRNIIVDVLEYFDAIRFTRREGEGRIVINRKLPKERFGP